MMAWGVLEFPQARPPCIFLVLMELCSGSTWCHLSRLITVLS